MAAGYLIRENYLSLNKPEEGKKSLWIGIVSTIALLTLAFMLPESFADSTSNKLIPAIYTGIAMLISAKIHGSILNKHKENGNEFYSRWHALATGIVSALILIVGIFGYIYLTDGGEELEKYEIALTEFSKNETESLAFYDHLNTETSASLLQELEIKTIPLWKENIEIIKRSNSIENLPTEFKEQNKKLLTYSELRLKALELYKRAISEESPIYNQELEKLHKDIDEQIEKLN